jgi:pimeloyl-ACP methyl ester carboxylesterase
VRYSAEGPVGGEASLWARDVRTTREGLAFTVVVDGRGEARFEIGVLGRHNVGNVLAATAVALELGMPLDEAADAARGIAPVEHRLQPIRGAGGVLVIDDAFNSNPRGAAEALRVLGELEGGKRVLVTPGMIELAEREWEENRAFGRLAAEVCDEVILVGPERARPILAGLREGEFPAERTHVVRDLGEATARLGTLVQPGDVILFENDLPDQYDDGTTPMGKSPHPNPLPEGEGVGLHPMSDSALPEGMRVVHVDSLRVAYRESGAGPPVVVLHGWGASGAAVTSILRCLEGEHRVIAPDLPGFGASDLPPDAWGSAEYAGCVRTFLWELGVERADFIGHSHGGRVAIRLATSDPGLVERLVLVDSAGIRPRHGPAYRARVLAFKAGRRAIAGWTRAVGTRNAAPVREWFARRFGSEDYRQAGPMRATLVRLVNEDLRALLPRVQAPTLLIWGEQDDFTPLAQGRLMEQLIPDAGLVVFPAAGHFSYADDPGRFCRIVGHFLKG